MSECTAYQDYIDGVQSHLLRLDHNKLGHFLDIDAMKARFAQLTEQFESAKQEGDPASVHAVAKALILFNEDMPCIDDLDMMNRLNIMHEGAQITLGQYSQEMLEQVVEEASLLAYESPEDGSPGADAAKDLAEDRLKWLNDDKGREEASQLPVPAMPGPDMTP